MTQQQSLNTKLAFTIPELVNATGIGRTTLYEEIKAGRLRTCKVGTRTLVTAEDAQAWLRALRDREAVDAS